MVYLVNVSSRDYLRNNNPEVQRLRQHLSKYYPNSQCSEMGSNSHLLVDSRFASTISSSDSYADDVTTKDISNYSGEINSNDSNSATVNHHINRKPEVAYYDGSLVVAVSVEFEYALHHEIYHSEGADAVSSYLIANPSHKSLVNPLLNEIAKNALGFITFYTVEIIDNDLAATGGSDGSTVQTGLTSAGFNSSYGEIKAWLAKDNTYAPTAGSYVDVNIKRLVLFFVLN